MAKNVCYGVRKGREGPKVYTTWEETSKQVNGFKLARYKGFTNREEAEAWVEDGSRSASSSRSVKLEPVSSGQSSTDMSIPDSDPADPVPAPDAVPEIIPAASAPANPDPTAPTIAEEEEEEEDPFPQDGEGLLAAPSQPPLNIELSDEQINILEAARRGESFFFTGSAGTGKSVLLREIIKSLRTIPPPQNPRIYRGSKVAVTASTGIASVNIGGSTLHSFAGIGLGKENGEKLAERVLMSKYTTKRWCKTRTLIIDEISMIDGTLFDKLEYVARRVRNCPLPFGGMQLIITGDFFQLPPVPDRHDGTILPVTFAFDAMMWDTCIQKEYTLTKVFRQEDEVFVSMLNDMRFGDISENNVQRFMALSREVQYEDGLEPTELYPLRVEVEYANQSRLNKLPKPEIEYLARDFPGYDIRHQPIPLAKATELLNRLIVLPRLSLRIGAQVMLIQNLVQGSLVNGSLGIVSGFCTTLEARERHIEFASPDTEKTQHAAKAKSKVSDQPDMLWPIVRFNNGQDLICTPTGFSVVNMFGGVEAQRDQVPLILAWALSIHKSQGQTLQRVKVDLGKVFEKGQVYVAISRATSLDSLQVLNFTPERVAAHSSVVRWWENRFFPSEFEEGPEEDDDEEDDEDESKHRVIPNLS